MSNRLVTVARLLGNPFRSTEKKEAIGSVVVEVVTNSCGEEDAVGVLILGDLLAWKDREKGFDSPRRRNWVIVLFQPKGVLRVVGGWIWSFCWRLLRQNRCLLERQAA